MRGENLVGGGETRGLGTVETYLHPDYIDITGDALELNKCPASGSAA